jgi:hypothetical protein
MTVDSKVAEVVNALPLHADFVKQCCAASEAAWDLTKPR